MVWQGGFIEHVCNVQDTSPKNGVNFRRLTNLVRSYWTRLLCIPVYRSLRCLMSLMHSPSSFYSSAFLSSVPKRLCYTGCVNRIAPSLFSIKCSRHCLNVEPDLARLFFKPRHEWGVFFSFLFLQMFSFLFFWNIWVLGDPIFPAEKKCKYSFVNGGVGAHRTRVPNFTALSPKNGVKIWTFVRKKMCNLRSYVAIT